MLDILNVTVVFKDKPIGLKAETFNNVKSAKVEDNYYRITRQNGDRQLFPLSSIERIIENFEGGIQMTYKELFAVTDLLNDIREGREIKINNNTRVDLAEVENYFKNLIADIDKKKVRSKDPIMYYRLAIEVNK